ncbi:hypothetical protein T484DRAFT_1913055 [Baffinella frigidus]|nr:hypothetical protein T484DRAFT_1913055 [Cryptophyta sp. CCMP2293]
MAEITPANDAALSPVRETVEDSASAAGGSTPATSRLRDHEETRTSSESQAGANRAQPVRFAGVLRAREMLSRLIKKRRRGSVEPAEPMHPTLEHLGSMTDTLEMHTRTSSGRRGTMPLKGPLHKRTSMGPIRDDGKTRELTRVDSEMNGKGAWLNAEDELAKQPR